MRHRIIWITFLTTLTFWLGCAGEGGRGGGGEKNYKVLENDPPRFAPEPPTRGPDSRAPSAAPIYAGLLQSAAAAPYERYPGASRSAKPKPPASAPATQPGSIDLTSDLIKELETPPPAPPAPATQPVSTLPRYERYPGSSRLYRPLPKPVVEAPATQPAPLVRAGQRWAGPNSGESVAVTNLPAAPVRVVFGEIQLTGSGTRAAASRPAATRPATDVAPSLSGLQRAGWPTTIVTPGNGRTTHNPTYFEDVTTSAARFPTVQDSQSTEEQIKTVLGHSHADTPISTQFTDFAVQPLKFAVDLITLPFQAVVEPPLKDVQTPPQN